MARRTGFTEIRLEYWAEVEIPAPLPTRDWDVIVRTEPNPLAPTLGQAIAQTLDAAERAEFESYVRSWLAGDAVARSSMATAYLWAVRP